MAKTMKYFMIENLWHTVVNLMEGIKMANNVNHIIVRCP